MFASVTRRSTRLRCSRWASRNYPICYRPTTFHDRRFSSTGSQKVSTVLHPERHLQKGRYYSSNSTKVKDDAKGDISPDRWIEALEAAANAKWLDLQPVDPADRLRRSYALMMQIILYLHRPQPEIEQYLVDFMQAEAAPGSEIQRAREATVVLIRAIVRDILSIPSHPLHADHPQVFAVFGALVPLHDMYLAGNEKESYNLDLADWTAFWERAQPVLLDLALKLDEQGFGLEKEEWEK